MNAPAQIRRATAIGHRAVEGLDAETQAALIDLYQAQAADIKARIAAHAGPDGNLALQELRSLLDQVEGILRRLSIERDALLTEALAKAADYGARPLLGAVMETGAVVTTAASMVVAQDALRFVQTFIAEDGLQLADRIWRLDRGAKDRIVNALESAIIQGHGAGEAARELLARGAEVPADVANKLTAANAMELSKTAQEIMTGSGSPMDNAMRLMRTEINRAHGEAYMMGGGDHPDFGGWRFLLSPRHPASDICDLLSTQNVHGLGPGVYPDRERLPWPAHPNTLSFVEIVFKDEITAADRAGKETPMAALARLTPAQREGVLGKGKTEIYDAGKLTQGMIRAPLSAVREKIGPMDTLPLFQEAAISARKLADYALNPQHETGSHKARRFMAALGFAATDAAEIERQIRQQLPRSEASKGKSDKHGQRYAVDVRLTGPAGKAIVRTAWIVEAEGVPPRLISLYVKES